MYRRKLGIIGLVGAFLALALLGSRRGPEALGQGGGPTLESDVRNIGVVLDCSGSMLDKLPDGKTKMDVAKEVVTDFIMKIPLGRKLTFIVYGLNPKLKCEDIQVVMPLTEVTNGLKKKLSRLVAGIVPLGQTPLAKSMRVAGRELQKGEPQYGRFVVITDGMESCRGNPGAVADDLAASLSLYNQQTVMIGLGVSKEEQAALNAMRRRSLRIIQTNSANDFKKVVEEERTRPQTEAVTFAEVEKDIKVRLKKANARPGPLEIALAWSNKNDLDLHVKPPSKEEIFYGHRKSRCGGEQDVDMNVQFGSATMRPVEHIVWSKRAPAGHYEVWVHHYRNHAPQAKVCKDPTPFVVSVKAQGETKVFRGALTNRGIDTTRRLVVAFNIDKKGGIHFVPRKAGPKKGPATKSSNPSGGASLFRGLLPEGDRLVWSPNPLEPAPRACGCLPRNREDAAVVRLEE